MSSSNDAVIKSAVQVVHLLSANEVRQVVKGEISFPLKKSRLGTEKSYQIVHVNPGRMAGSWNWIWQSSVKQFNDRVDTVQLWGDVLRKILADEKFRPVIEDPEIS